jgi:DNA-directed RNA polymerase subunit N
MIIPVRCFTCGFVIGKVWDEYQERVEDGESAGEVLDDLGVDRYCCRRMILSHREKIDEVQEYSI